MSPWVAWLAYLAVGVIAVVRMVAVDERSISLAVCGAVALAFALLAVGEDSRLKKNGASDGVIAAASARQMSLVWVWGAACLVIIYLTLLQWREWWHFFTAFAVAGVVSLWLSFTLERDAKAGATDDTMLKLARMLAWGQLVGMAAAIAGLFIDGKVMRHLNPVKYPDWAGNHIFLCGAAALFVISANALFATRAKA